MLNIKQFYKDLGKLLHAVAMADGEIQGSEVEALHEFISREFALSENTTDSSGMNQAFYVDFEFDYCSDNKINMLSAGNLFIKFQIGRAHV